MFPSLIAGSDRKAGNPTPSMIQVITQSRMLKIRVRFDLILQQQVLLNQTTATRSVNIQHPAIKFDRLETNNWFTISQLECLVMYLVNTVW